MQTATLVTTCQVSLPLGLQVTVLHWVPDKEPVNGYNTDSAAQSGDTHFWPRETGSCGGQRQADF